MFDKFYKSNIYMFEIIENEFVESLFLLTKHIDNQFICC